MNIQTDKLKTRRQTDDHTPPPKIFTNQKFVL